MNFWSSANKFFCLKVELVKIFGFEKIFNGDSIGQFESVEVFLPLNIT